MTGSAVGPLARFADAYHTVDEIHDEMRRLAAQYNAVYIDSIGRSHGGRDIPVIRFGGGRGTKTFWIQGGLHAREWITPATVNPHLNTRSRAQTHIFTST